MPLEYENRRGDRYYVLEGKTKTGKPKFYCAKKPNGLRVEDLPEGWELHENPRDAIVTVRRVRPSHILPADRESLNKWVFRYAGILYAIVEVEDDSLVVYTPDIDPNTPFEVLSMACESRRRPEAVREWVLRRANYSPMFRFRLTNPDTRAFCVDRWCFRGSVDGWYCLSGTESLAELAREFLPHLDKESFFELM